MFLFTQTNRLREADVAAEAEPARERSAEDPVVRAEGAALLTRPKPEGRSKS